jgi:hypothetical protein
MKQEVNQAPTFESVWAALQETDRMLKESGVEFDRKMAESRVEFDQKMAESRAEFDRKMEDSRAEFDRRMAKHDDTMGSWARNHGSVAEEYFFNSFEKGMQNFFGEKFDDIDKKLKGPKKGFKDEYDILLINCKSVAIIETKFKAHMNDLEKVLKKAETLRENFPYYAHHQVYLGLASLSFYSELEQECIKQGIAVIKQVGDTVVINDKCLKVF